jgi:phosphoribosylformimino-5-aminoimidazole carboxamide ribotide isomerase
LILGLDARDGLLAIAGWEASSTVQAVDFAKAVAGLDLAAIVYTDIARDGMLSGVNVAATLALAVSTDVPVIASGGVTSLEDLSLLLEAFAGSERKLFGAITGRAIYSGTLDFRAGQALLDRAA